MKVGIITDIHNNCDALNAVLNEFSLIGVEKIICCGDILGIGPKPDETVKRVMMLQNIECVRGNHDNYLIGGIPNKVPNDEMISIEEMKHHKWEHSKLCEASAQFINSLPYTKNILIGQKRIYVAHYSIDKNNKYVNYIPNPKLDDLKVMFKNVDADIVIYGHNHNPSVNNESDVLYINSGSLGCPVGTLNFARAGILNINSEGVSYHQLEVPYDVDKVVDDIKE